MEFRLMCGGAIEELRKIPDKSVNTCVTSPPYYGLRDYGTGTWVGGDPNCPHYRTTKRSDITATGHKTMIETGHPIGDAIYKTVCPICGAIRVDNQIGLEETPEDYINRLVEVFREVKRVLRDDGILSDFGYDGEGIVHVCHCTNCGAEIEYRIRIDDEDQGKEC